MPFTTIHPGRKWLAGVNGSQPQILRESPDSTLMLYSGRILLIDKNTQADSFRCWLWKRSPLIRPTILNGHEESWSTPETQNHTNQNTSRRSNTRYYTS